MKDNLNHNGDFIFKVALSGKGKKYNQADREILEHYVPYQKKNNELPVIFPFATLPFNLRANTLMITNGMSLGWKIWEAYHKQKLAFVADKQLQCLIGLDVQDTLSKLESKTEYELFIPDKTQESEKLYFSDLSADGIKMFALLKKQNETKDLKPWIGLYQKMIDKSLKNKTKLKNATSKINLSDLNIFLQNFSVEYQMKIRKILVIDKKEIPQSILSINDIK